MDLLIITTFAFQLIIYFRPQNDADLMNGYIMIEYIRFPLRLSDMNEKFDSHFDFAF